MNFTSILKNKARNMDLRTSFEKLSTRCNCQHVVLNFDVIPFKSLITNSFEDMKIYVEKVEEHDVHPGNTLYQEQRRSRKKGNLSRRSMSKYNKTFFQTIGVSPHYGKCPAESKVCNKCKKHYTVAHYTNCCKTK